jgi:hypothetical protein
MHKLIRTIFYALGVTALVATVAGTSWLMWETRRSEIPGSYSAEGVWGSSTLILKKDHTFVQEVRFMEYDEPPVAPYPRHTTMSKSVTGTWEEYGRSWFDQKLGIKPFISLLRLDNGKTYESFPASFGPVALTGLGIEIDISRGIVYRK